MQGRIISFGVYVLPEVKNLTSLFKIKTIEIEVPLSRLPDFEKL